jgi:uncharacterized protein YecE (DUF72 family)
VAEVRGASEPVVRAGTAGWSYPDWEGIVYPARAGPAFDRLRFLASIFDTLEINTFFYRLPERRQVESWARRVADRERFRFTVKAWRALTHDEPAAGVGDLRRSAAEFRARLPPLSSSGRLGAVLLQFPFRFRADASGWRRLETLVEALRELPLAAEFRRREWAEASALERLRALGVGFCNIDQPDLPGNLPPGRHVTARLGYVRLHGRNAADWFREGTGRDARYDYLYSPEEIAEWAGRVRAIAAAGAEEIFVIANNHYRGKAACNALELRRALEDPAAVAPEPLREAFPRLGPGGRPSPQGRLF